jgi:hypothetical protein
MHRHDWYEVCCLTRRPLLLLCVLLADKEAASPNGVPKVDVTITDCGEL